MEWTYSHFQLILGDPQVFSIQISYIIPRVISAYPAASYSHDMPQKPADSVSKGKAVLPSGRNSFFCPIIPAISFCGSLPKVHDCRWGRDHRSTAKSKAWPSSSAPFSLQQSCIMSILLLMLHQYCAIFLLIYPIQNKSLTFGLHVLMKV